MLKRLLPLICTFFFIAVEARTHVFLIGDSTTETWGQDSYPCMGWGAVLHHFFNKDKVVVYNKAVGGTSTKSFYKEYWSNVIAKISSGDYLFVSFGANDSNTYSSVCTTTDEFINYIGIFCNAARGKGAIPVLLSTVNRNWWSTNGELKQTYGQHPKAMQEAAVKYDTPFIDLYTFGYNLSKESGIEYNTYYRHNNYMPNEYIAYPEGKEDGVHLQETGATDFARYIVEEIEKSTDKRLKTLADATAPRYNVTFDTDNESKTSSISHSATFPEGINVTLKSYGVTVADKCFWKNDKGDVISKDNVYVYIMQNHDEHFTAVYNEPSPLDMDEFKLFKDRIVFTDNQKHHIEIYNFYGCQLFSTDIHCSFLFSLPAGSYILRIDGKKSMKFIVP